MPRLTAEVSRYTSENWISQLHHSTTHTTAAQALAPNDSISPIWHHSYPEYFDLIFHSGMKWRCIVHLYLHQRSKLYYVGLFKIHCQSVRFFHLLAVQRQRLPFSNCQIFYLLNWSQPSEPLIILHRSPPCVILAVSHNVETGSSHLTK